MLRWQRDDSTAVLQRRRDAELQNAAELRAQIEETQARRAAKKAEEAAEEQRAEQQAALGRAERLVGPSPKLSSSRGAATPPLSPPRHNAAAGRNRFETVSKVHRTPMPSKQVKGAPLVEEDASPAASAESKTARRLPFVREESRGQPGGSAEPADCDPPPYRTEPAYLDPSIRSRTEERLLEEIMIEERQGAAGSAAPTIEELLFAAGLSHQGRGATSRPATATSRPATATSRPATAGPIVVGYTHEQRLSRMVQWERERMLQREMQEREAEWEAEKEREREAARARELHRLASRLVELEAKVEGRETERRDAFEHRMTAELSAVRRELAERHRTTPHPVRPLLFELPTTHRRPYIIFREYY